MQICKDIACGKKQRIREFVAELIMQRESACAIVMIYLSIFTSFGCNYATPLRENEGGICRDTKTNAKESFLSPVSLHFGE